MSPSDLAHRMEWWWDIQHLGHHAWYQRAVVLGDMAPGREPVAYYCGDDDGRAFDPTLPPSCATCGQVPRTEDLEAIERTTGGAHLEKRRGKLNLLPPTDPDTCWWCNGPGAEGSPPLCPPCAAKLGG